MTHLKIVKYAKKAAEIRNYPLLPLKTDNSASALMMVSRYFLIDFIFSKMKNIFSCLPIIDSLASETSCNIECKDNTKCGGALQTSIYPSIPGKRSIKLTFRIDKDSIQVAQVNKFIFELGLNLKVMKRNSCLLV